MPIKITMPQLSPTMTEGTLSKWLVKEGDEVSSGDILAEIETDKATMEVEAVDDGVVEAILVAAGTEGVKVNTPIARLKAEGGATVLPQSAPTEPPAPPQGGSKIAPPPSSPLVGEGGRPKGGGGASAPAATNGSRILASPLAKRIAQQSGIDLAGVKGSGPRGRIVKADLDGAKGGAPRAASALAAAPAGAPAQVKSLESLGIPAGSYMLTPLDGMRKVIARRLTESFRDIPHFPLTMDLEIDRLLEARVKINASLEKAGVKVSVNDLLIKASAMALKAVPAANASFTPEGIAMHHHADVAVAVAIEGGLITPIIREAENRSLADISKAMKDLAARARERKLAPHEFQGGTFSLSNLGMFGIKSFSSIINEPQGMILSVGAGEQRPVVRGGQLAIATVMTVTVTCDHRVVDGSIGAEWIRSFKAFVEDPVTMLA